MTLKELKQKITQKETKLFLEIYYDDSQDNIDIDNEDFESYLSEFINENIISEYKTINKKLIWYTQEDYQARQRELLNEIQQENNDNLDDYLFYGMQRYYKDIIINNIHKAKQ